MITSYHKGSQQKTTAYEMQLENNLKQIKHFNTKCIDHLEGTIRISKLSATINNNPKGTLKINKPKPQIQ